MRAMVYELVIRVDVRVFDEGGELQMIFNHPFQVAEVKTVQRRSAIFCTVMLTFSNSVFAEPNDSDSDDEAEENVSVAALLDDQATNDMHDDTTLLRNVSVLEDQTGLVFFDALRIWLGGAV